MNGIISLLRALYYKKNKLFFVIAVIAITIFIVGCSTQGGSPPPGPVGGGCG